MHNRRKLRRRRSGEEKEEEERLESGIEASRLRRAFSRDEIEVDDDDDDALVGCDPLVRENSISRGLGHWKLKGIFSQIGSPPCFPSPPHFSLHLPFPLSLAFLGNILGSCHCRPNVF